MLKLRHKNLDVWKFSMDFVTDIYAVTQNFPKSELYGLVNQLRRAAVSIPSNIAEGAARKSPAERKRFYEIARSSLVEIDTQLEIAVKLKYLDDDRTELLAQQMNSIFAMLSQLINKTK